MNIKKTLFAALLATVSMGAMAQDGPKTEYVFQPHWYVQGQIGGQYTLGEVDFCDLLSPNAQVALGYNFNKVLGARLAVGAWQSKAGISGKEDKWKWNYVSPAIDITANLSNLIAGVNPNRLVDVSVFLGGGLNIGFNNDEAGDLKAKYLQQNVNNQNIRYYWDDSKLFAVGRAGLMVDFKVSERVNVGLEVNANLTGDHYNSKKAGNNDWYFNALAGVKINLGKTYTKKEIPAPQPIIEYRDRIVEKIVEKPVPAPAPVIVEKDPLRIDVFFTIASTKLVGSEAQKVNEIATYLKKYPEAKVNITGYADKGTGNATINNKLSMQRAEIVKNELINKYGIAADRIVTDYKGDTVQPFDVEVLNRVSICICK